MSEQQRDQLNKAEDVYDKNFNSQFSPKSAQTTNDSSEKNRQQLANQESHNGTDGKKAIGDTAVGKAALSTAAATGGPTAKIAAQLLGRIKSRGGATGAIAGFVGAAILAGSIFLGPNLLLMQMKSVFADKFNDVAAVLDNRSEKVFIAKLKNDPIKNCTIKATCRYKSFSEKEVERWKKAGINPVLGEKNAFGRYNVSALEFPNGEKVDAKNFRAKRASLQTGVLKNVRNVFNSRYVAYDAAPFDNKTRFKLKITKQQNLTATTKEALDIEYREKLQGTAADLPGNKLTKVGNNYVDSNGNVVADDVATQYNNLVDEYNQQLDEVKQSGKKVVFNFAKSGTLTAMTGGLGAADIACTAYGTVRAIGYGAKTIIALQLARAFMQVVNTADAQQASYVSNIQPEPVQYIANKLTATNVDGKSATDSFGYNFAAYGDIAMPQKEEDRANILQFSTAGGLAGMIVNFTSKVEQFAGGSPKAVCGVIKNPWAQAGLLVGGILLTVGTLGSNLTVGTAVAASAGVAFSLVLAAAIPIVTNMVAGTIVTTDTVGADLGNAVTAGGGVMNASNGQSFALSPLQKNDVNRYYANVEKQNEMNRLADLEGVSPFDISNPHTLASKTILALGTGIKVDSLPSLIQSPMAMVDTAMRRSVPTAHATSYSEQYGTCEDFDYKEYELAADPFCNLRYGLSEQSLSQDAESVAQQMLDKGQIDGETGQPIPGSDYENFIKDCIDRVEPIGATGDDFQGDAGLRCIQGESGYDKNFDLFRIYYVDNVILGWMDEDEATAGTTSEQASGSTSLAKAELTKTSENIPCSSGSKDVGIHDGYYDGIKVRIRLCAVTDLPSSGGESNDGYGVVGAGGKAVVNSRISQNMVSMVAAMKTSGLSPSATSSFRSMAHQQELYNRYGSGQAARPGTSNHQMGYAIDYNMGAGNGNDVDNCKFVSGICTPPVASPLYNWLKANSKRYGFGQYSKEFWHWDLLTLRN